MVEDQFSFRHAGEKLEILIDRGKKWAPLLNVEDLAEQEGPRLCRWMARQYPFMPGAEQNTPAIPLPARYLKGPIADELVIFAGSFDPWHEGHQACLSLCPKRPVLVVPDRNPWKEKTPARCPFARFQKLAIHLEKSPHSIYPGFLGLPDLNPTANWIDKIKVPRKTLLMGDDNFLNLHRWQRVENILAAIAGIFVCPRQGIARNLKAQERRLRTIKPQLKITFLPHHKSEGISSSNLR